MSEAQEIDPPVDVPVTPERPVVYKIIRGQDIADLATACDAAMWDGWVPLGGAVYCPPSPQEMAHPHHPYWQTFVRKPPAREV